MGGGVDDNGEVARPRARPIRPLPLLPEADAKAEGGESVEDAVGEAVTQTGGRWRRSPSPLEASASIGGGDLLAGASRWSHHGSHRRDRADGDDAGLSTASSCWAEHH